MVGDLSEPVLFYSGIELPDCGLRGVFVQTQAFTEVQRLLAIFIYHTVVALPLCGDLCGVQRGFTAGMEASFCTYIVHLSACSGIEISHDQDRP